MTNQSPQELESEALEAGEFLISFRGRILLAQALRHGIEQMSKVPERRREVSNIEQMQYLLDNFAIDIHDDDADHVIR